MRALVRLGTRLFVGGDSFTQVAAHRRINLAAFDTVSGSLLPWDPGTASQNYSSVFALALNPDGSQLYVNGIFDRLGGASRRNFASVSTTTGRATSFAPNPDTNAHGDCVAAFAASRARIYAWGYYSHIGGKAATLSGAALDPKSGRLLARQPASDGGPFSTIVVGDTVYLGGVFHTLAGAARDDLGAIVGSTAAATPWAPRTGPHLIVEQIARWNHSIVAALAASHWNAGPRRFVAYDDDNAHVIWRSPTSFNGYVNAIATNASTILIAGGPSYGP